MNPRFSISETAYTVKPKGKENCTIKFKEQTLTVAELAERIRQGHAFCAVFYHNGNTFSIIDKKNDNFMYSWYIGVDFDNMGVEMQPFLDALPIKPSIAYTTSSNGKPNKGYCYRFVFILDEPVMHPKVYKATYYAIMDKLGVKPEETHDKCGDQCSRMFYGSYNCEMVLSPTVIQVSSLNANRYYNVDTTSPTATAPSVSSSTALAKLDGKFAEDWNNDKMKCCDILEEYANVYGDWKRTPDYEYNENGVYYYKPTDAEIRIATQLGDVTKAAIIKKGKRDIMAFKYATQIRLINPNITLNGLVYALAELVNAYFEKDGETSKYWIYRKAALAMELPFEELRGGIGRKFTTDPLYAEANGVSRNEMARAEKQRNHDAEIAQWFNPLLSDKENIKAMNEHGVKCSARYLKSYREKNGLSKRTALLNEFNRLLVEHPNETDVFYMSLLGVSRRTYYGLKRSLK